jgi:hypothetical protein
MQLAAAFCFDLFTLSLIGGMKFFPTPTYIQWECTLATFSEVNKDMKDANLAMD